MRQRAWFVTASWALALWAGPATAAVPPSSESRGVTRDEVGAGRAGDVEQASEDTVSPAPSVYRADSDAEPAVQSGPPSGSGMGALVYEQQLMRQELQQLRGQFEELAHRLDRLDREGQERYLDIDRRLQQGGAMAATAATTPPVSVPAIGGDDAERAAYAAAVELMKAREFQAAIDSFNSFLTGFPNGRYAVNAYYWLGELYMALPEPEFERARQSFAQVVNLYPDNAKVPDSLYKLGIVHDRMGDQVKAREYLERVRLEYPASTAAGLAQKQLAQLN